MDVETLDLVSISETTYRCPVEGAHCRWHVTCTGKHDPEKIRKALSVHLRVHARRPEGCPKYLDTMHMLDRGDWWLTAERDVIKVTEMTDRHLINAIAMLQRRAGLGLLSSYFPWWLKIAPEEIIDDYERTLMDDPMAELKTTATWKSLTTEAKKRGLVSAMSNLT